MQASGRAAPKESGRVGASAGSGRIVRVESSFSRTHFPRSWRQAKLISAFPPPNAGSRHPQALNQACAQSAEVARRNEECPPAALQERTI